MQLPGQLKSFNSPPRLPSTQQTFKQTKPFKDPKHQVSNKTKIVQFREEEEEEEEEDGDGKKMVTTKGVALE